MEDVVNDPEHYKDKRIEELRSENKRLRELIDLYEYGITCVETPAEGLEWSRKTEEIRKELGIKDKPWQR